MANHQVKGENNPKAKLTVEEVKEIRTIWKTYKGIHEPKMGKPTKGQARYPGLYNAPNNRATSAKKLARLYQVKPSTITSIVLGQTWKGIY